MKPLKRLGQPQSGTGRLSGMGKAKMYKNAVFVNENIRDLFGHRCYAVKIAMPDGHEVAILDFGNGIDNFYCELYEIEFD